MKKYASPGNILLFIALSGYLALLLITFYHRQPPLFDEPLFINNIPLFEQHGLSREFLVNLDNQAPGPLYQFVHYYLKPVTHLETPGIRLVNVVLLGLMICLLAAIIMRMHRGGGMRKAWTIALGTISIPVAWQVAGMALTEVPPMFFATLSIWLLMYALDRGQRSLAQLFLFTIPAGVALGFAILGRSPFLMMVPAAWILMLYQMSNSRRWLTIAIYSACALAICVPVFIIWEGLMPPQQAFTGAGGIRIWHGVLAFAYGALVTIIIAPGWFLFSKKTVYALALTYIILLTGNFFLFHETYAPLSEALEKILPDAIMRLYPYFISPFLAMVAGYFLYCSAIRAWEKRAEPFFLFLLAAAMLVLASSFKVTHLFSSRYVAQATPFMVLCLMNYDKFSYGRCVRMALGISLGILSLETYFNFK